MAKKKAPIPAAQKALIDQLIRESVASKHCLTREGCLISSKSALSNRRSKPKWTNTLVIRNCFASAGNGESGLLS